MAQETIDVEDNVVRGTVYGQMWERYELNLDLKKLREYYRGNILLGVCPAKLYFAIRNSLCGTYSLPFPLLRYESGSLYCAWHGGF